MKTLITLALFTACALAQPSAPASQIKGTPASTPMGLFCLPPIPPPVPGPLSPANCAFTLLRLHSSLTVDRTAGEIRANAIRQKCDPLKPTGTVTTMTLTSQPVSPPMVFWNGLLAMTGDDYTITSSTVTFLSRPDQPDGLPHAGDVIQVCYLY